MNKLKLILLSATFAVSQNLESIAQVDSDTTVRAAESVVKLTAEQCSDGNSRSGTGFVFGDRGSIVTALHVVANCHRVSAWFERETASPRRSATLAKALPDRDLALLSLDSQTSQPPLPSGAKPMVNGYLSAIGYARDQRTLQDWSIQLSIGSRKPPDGTSTLSEMLDIQTTRDISGGTPLSTDSTVLRLSSPLQPGMSGGPIIDSRGNVVGIVGGGLERGLAPISWGWPSDYLTDLLRAPAAASVTFRYDRNLYASVSNTRPTRTIKCGNLDFVQIDRRSFAELAKANDDPYRVGAVVQASLLPISEINSLEFEIWQHEGTGAIVAVPAGVDLEEGNGKCEGSSPDGNFRQIVSGSYVEGPQEIQTESVQFEISTTSQYYNQNFGVQPDQILTTWTPQTRPDSFVVRRKGAIWPQGPWMPGTPPPRFVHGFETIMSRGSSFVGIMTINENYITNLPGCIQDCFPTRDYLRTFAHFILATQLSTYPIY